MKTKTAKAQLEVWKWQDKAYALIKGLPKDEQIKFIVEQTKQTVEWLKARKKQRIKLIDG